MSVWSHEWTANSLKNLGTFDLPCPKWTPVGL
jgi:hypothetical protein